MAERPRGRRAVLRSVRFRITAVAVLVLLAVLTLTGVALVALQRTVLTENLDDGLVEQADVLEAQAVAGDVATVLVVAGDDDLVAQVVTTGGRTVGASEDLVGARPVAALPSEAGERVTSVGSVVAAAEPHRLVTRRIDDTPLGDVVIFVAAPTDDVDESSDVLVRSLAGVIPLVGVVLAVLVWWLVGRTLRPVEAIRADVAAMGGDDLHRRVTVPPTGDEIAQLAGTMNAMLDRVERASELQRQFVADASHELRTPLTRMRAELEVDLAHPDTADLVATHESLLEETEGLQRLVEDLLLLARTADDHVGGGAVVDLREVVERELALATPSRTIPAELAAASPGPVRGDVAQLRRAVRNLVENARHHAASAVTVALEQTDGRVVLTVDDDGPGVPEGERDRIFERFARVDAARSTVDGGSGLGLAITRAIVERHGGTVSVGTSPLGGARFVVVLPAVAPDG